jgi:hypothetical protein
VRTYRVQHLVLTLVQRVHGLMVVVSQCACLDAVGLSRMAEVMAQFRRTVATGTQAHQQEDEHQQRENDSGGSAHLQILKGVSWNCAMEERMVRSAAWRILPARIGASQEMWSSCYCVVYINFTVT